jgi:hypothetical protein
LDFKLTFVSSHLIYFSCNPILIHSNNGHVNVGLSCLCLCWHIFKFEFHLSISYFHPSWRFETCELIILLVFNFWRKNIVNLSCHFSYQCLIFIFHHRISSFHLSSRVHNCTHVSNSTHSFHCFIVASHHDFKISLIFPFPSTLLFCIAPVCDCFLFRLLIRHISVWFSFSSLLYSSLHSRGRYRFFSRKLLNTVACWPHSISTVCASQVVAVCVSSHQLFFYVERLDARYFYVEIFDTVPTFDSHYYYQQHNVQSPVKTSEFICFVFFVIFVVYFDSKQVCVFECSWSCHDDFAIWILVCFLLSWWFETYIWAHNFARVSISICSFHS